MDLVLCLISQEIWGSLHAEAHSKAIIQERFKTLSYMKSGKWMVTIELDVDQGVYYKPC